MMSGLPDITPILKTLMWFVPVMTFLGCWKLIDIAIWLCQHTNDRVRVVKYVRARK